MLGRYRQSMLRPTRRTLEHWTRDLGTPQEWLALMREQGWVVEHSWLADPVVVNGRHV
jgi:hypothetical protein